MLRVISNDKKIDYAPTCTIAMDDTVDRFTDFVAVGWDYNKHTAVLIQNADAVTLGYAYLMIAKAFKENYTDLSEEDKSAVDEALKGEGMV